MKKFTLFLSVSLISLAPMGWAQQAKTEEKAPKVEAKAAEKEMSDEEKAKLLEEQSKEIDRLLKRAASGLDNDFFKAVLPKKSVLTAYLQAQKEDFEGTSADVVSNEIFSLTKKDAFVKHPHNGTLLELDTALRGIEDETLRNLSIARWRGLFLDALGGYMRHKNSQKPEWRLILSNTTTHDSNVNLVPEGEPGPAKHNGKDDIFNTASISLNWSPMVNKPGFSSKWKYDQLTNIVRTLNSQVKENEVMILDTEAKVVRKLKNKKHLKNLRLGYRARIFRSSERPTEKDLFSNFKEHRFRIGLIGKDRKSLNRRLSDSHTEFDIYASFKEHFQESKSVKDAFVTRFVLAQIMGYKKGGQRFELKPSLEYSTYDTDNSPSSDYRYYKFKLDHRHSYTMKSSKKRKLRFTESFSYRAKTWSDFAGGDQDEDQIQIRGRVSTKIYKSLNGSLSLSHTWKDLETNTATTKTSTDAKQFQVALGLQWSM